MAGEEVRAEMESWRVVAEANTRKIDDVRLADESGTFEALEAVGYKANWCRHLADDPQVLLQKRIRGEDRGTLYFINVWAYDWRKYRPNYLGPPVSYMPTAQFNTFSEGSPPAFNVEMLLPNRNEQLDVPAIERFFADIYARMDCVPYEKADE